MERFERKITYLYTMDILTNIFCMIFGSMERIFKAKIMYIRALFIFHDGWMDDLRSYVLFYCISVISGRWLGDNERLRSMEPRLRLEKFPPQAGLESGTARSDGQRLTR